MLYAPCLDLDNLVNELKQIDDIPSVNQQVPVDDIKSALGVVGNKLSFARASTGKVEGEDDEEEEEEDGAKAKDTQMLTFSSLCHKKNRVKLPRISRSLVDREELSRVSLLGQMVSIGRLNIILCPQYKCGRPMVLNPDKCVSSRRGYACARCSEKIRTARVMKYQESWSDSKRLQSLFEKQSCVVCDRALKPKTKAFIYPGDQLVCQYCQRESFITIANAFEASSGTIDSGDKKRKDKLLQLLVQEKKKMREDYANRYAKYNDMMMRRNKRKDRMVKRK
jgi:hypothetical protein